jgi:Holliday junction resolvase RusA-like endonuclease
MSLILCIDPMGAPRMTRADAWKKRPVVLSYHAYKDAIRKHYGQRPIPKKLVVFFQIAMPPSWSKKMRDNERGMPHRNKPDLDNLLKGVMDALWEKDAGLANVEMRKDWGDFGCIYIDFQGEA